MKPSSLLDSRYSDIPDNEILKILKSYEVFIPENQDRDFLLQRAKDLPTFLPIRKSYSIEDVIDLFDEPSLRKKAFLSDVLSENQRLVDFLHSNHVLSTSDFLILEQPIFQEALLDEKISKKKLLSLVKELKGEENRKDDFSKMTFVQLLKYFEDSNDEKLFKKAKKAQRRSEIYELDRPFSIIKKKKIVFENLISSLASLNIDVSFFGNLPEESVEDFQSAIEFLNKNFRTLGFSTRNVKPKGREMDFSESFAEGAFLYDYNQTLSDNQIRKDLAEFPPGIRKSKTFITVFEWEQLFVFFNLQPSLLRSLLVWKGYNLSEIDFLDTSSLLFLILRGKSEILNLKSLWKRKIQVQSFLESLKKNEKSAFFESLGKLFGYPAKKEKILISLLVCYRFSSDVEKLLNFMLEKNFIDAFKEFQMIPFYSEEKHFLVFNNCLNQILPSILENKNQISDVKKINFKSLRYFSDLSLLSETGIQPVYSNRDEMLEKIILYLSSEEEILFFNLKYSDEDQIFGFGNKEKRILFGPESIPSNLKKKSEMKELLEAWKKLQNKAPKD